MSGHVCTLKDLLFLKISTHLGLHKKYFRVHNHPIKTREHNQTIIEVTMILNVIYCTII